MGMPDFRAIYERDAERYQRLVAAEDGAGELPRALGQVVALRGARVVEVGMGTGRVTRILLDAGASVLGYERSAAMVAVARRLLGQRFDVVVADVREAELPVNGADLALAGWCLGHFCEWFGDDWQAEIEGVLQKMWGALDPGGTLVLIETLGTGGDMAHPPNAELAAYYRLLENDWGMQRRELRTDYHFESVEAARESIGFFFGAELESRVAERGWRVVPEWTGLWWKKKVAL
jgi:SAM-dependent methyltransferase